MRARAHSQVVRLHQILETHAHADHLSGAQALKSRFGAGIVIGERIEVQRVFQRIFGLPDSFRTDGSQFDRLLARWRAAHPRSPADPGHPYPGHTPRLPEAISSAMPCSPAMPCSSKTTAPAAATSRAAAPQTLRLDHGKLYRLPDATRVFVGHDYLPGGRPLRFETTIGRQQERQHPARQDTGRDEFIAARNRRDATLSAPPAVSKRASQHRRWPPARRKRVRATPPRIPLTSASPSTTPAHPARSGRRAIGRGLLAVWLR